LADVPLVSQKDELVERVYFFGLRSTWRYMSNIAGNHRSG